MKNLSKVVLAIASLFFLYSYTIIDEKEPKTDEKISDLKGNIKSLKHMSYGTINNSGKVEKGKIRTVTGNNYQRNFDKQGNLIELNNYKYDGSLDSKSTYTYDEKGNRIGEDYFNAIEYLNHKSTYTYDERGNKIEISTSSTKGLIEGKGLVNGKHTFIYDTNNKIEHNYRCRGNLVYKNTYKYDVNGNQVEFTLYGGTETKATYTHKYKYDANGNKIEKNNYKSDGSLYSKHIYKYDNRNNQIEKNSYKPNGDLVYKETCKYDKFSNQIEKKGDTFDGNVNVEITSYEYDEKGNWTKEIKFENNVAKKITERIFKYFK